MYLVYQLGQTSGSVTSSDHIPQDVTNSFVTSKSCSSSKDIIALDFSLAKPPTIVGLKATIEPRSSQAQDVILKFISNWYFTIYIPSRTVDERHDIVGLPTILGALPESIDFNIATLYAGKGGRILDGPDDLSGPLVFDGHTSEQHTNSLGAPPAYHQFTSGLSQAFPSKRP